MALEVPEVLRNRAQATEERLLETHGALRSFDLVEERHPWVTLFATGSLGRCEISRYSDLDVFILDAAQGDAYGEGRLGRLERYLLVADFIRAGTAAGFPPFPRDGEFFFLQDHRLEHLVAFLGKPDEDKLYAFTVRMLLLLESTCLVGRAAYDRSVDFVIDRYWVEDAREKQFRPIFLINDIVRYWKSMCVSYEGRREARGGELDADARLDLLKLKFNRAWLCFTGVAYLLLGENPGYFPRTHARRMVDLKPVSRMVEIAERVPDLTDLIEDILQAYAAWLGRAGHDKADLLAWVDNDDNYRAILERAQQFGDLMRDVVNALGNRADLIVCTTCRVRGLENDVSRSRSKAN